MNIYIYMGENFELCTKQSEEDRNKKLKKHINGMFIIEVHIFKHYKNPIIPVHFLWNKF